MKFTPQVSLRELLLLILFAAAGLTALRAGGVLAGAVLLLAMLLTMGLAIVALVRRDRLQAFAIGFVVPACSYFVLVWAMGVNELDPYEGRLPTTRLMQPVQQAFMRNRTTETATGKVLGEYRPNKRTSKSRTIYDAFGTYTSEFPDRAIFMSVAHVLIAMLLGYVGGKFGAAIWQREDRSDSS